MDFSDECAVIKRAVQKLAVRTSPDAWKSAEGNRRDRETLDFRHSGTAT